MKFSEEYSDGSKAQERAKSLRANEFVSHVTVNKNSDKYIVGYSVQTIYYEESKKLGIKI
jgi:hypothetical protein